MNMLCKYFYAKLTVLRFTKNTLMFFEGFEVSQFANLKKLNLHNEGKF